MFWGLATAYLSIGIVWCAFAAYKQARLHPNAHPYKLALVVVLNAFAWPAAIPIGIYRIVKK